MTSRARLRLPQAILIIGLLASLFAALVAARGEDERVRARFDGLTSRAVTAVTNKIDTQRSLLRGAAGLFAASASVTREDFRRYVDRLSLEQNYPGVLGIGFAAYGETRTALAGSRFAAAGAGPRALRAWPESSRSDYSSIVFLEPLNARNQAAIGYDMMSEPTRREAMRRARASGQATLSGKVTLVQEIEKAKQPGFLLYQPLAIGDRFAGWTYSPLRAHDLFRATLTGPELAGISIAIFDGRPGQASLLFESAAVRGDETLRNVRSLTLAGRDLTLVATALPGFAGSSGLRLALAIGVGGALATFLLAALAAQQQRLVARVEREVAERTSELTDANRRLEAEMIERGKVEAQVQQLQKMEAVGQLTGGIAHDFNNMLAIVVGNLDMAQRLPDLSARAGRLVGNAMKGATKAAELTQRLLAFARRQPLAPSVIDPNRLVAGMSELLRRTLGERVELEAVLAGGVWPVMADAPQLESAILNLAVNARDAMPEGGRLTIETANCRLDEEYAAANAGASAGQFTLIAVSDSGEGMSDEVRARAFEPFFTTKAVGKGSGLGLSQVFGFVRQSGGHLAIYSEPGRGTTLKIYLPRYVGSERAKFESDSAGDAMPQGAADELVLVVEDEEEVRLFSVEALRGLGYTVIHAANGAEALDTLEANPGVRIVFTDVVMPRLDGRQLADAAEARWPHLKFLFTTGYTRNAIVHHDRLDEGRALLTKPFTVDQLARKVRAALDA